MRTPPPVLPPDRDRSDDRRSWLQRQDADTGLVLRMAGALVPIFAFSLFLAFRLAAVRGWMGAAGSAAAVAVASLMTAAAGIFIRNLSNAGGAVATAVIQGSGSSSPYEEQFSYPESLAARGDVAGALASYEAAIAERPETALPRLRAAELHARRGGDPSKAAELFRSVRDLPSASRRDALYASNRLVDLYDGPLGEPGRAIVELRRIIERFPGTEDAHRARTALPRLKSRLSESRSEP